MEFEFAQLCGWADLSSKHEGDCVYWGEGAVSALALLVPSPLYSGESEQVGSALADAFSGVCVCGPGFLRKFPEIASAKELENFPVSRASRPCL